MFNSGTDEAQEMQMLGFMSGPGTKQRTATARGKVDALHPLPARACRDALVFVHEAEELQGAAGTCETYV